MINTANIGDVISSLGVVDLAQKKFNSVDFWARPDVSPILKDEPGIRILQEEAELRAQHYELILDLDSSSKSRKIIKQTGGNLKVGRYWSFKDRAKGIFYYNKMFPKSPHDNLFRDYEPFMALFDAATLPLPKLHARRPIESGTNSASANAKSPKNVGLHFSANSAHRTLPLSVAHRLVSELINLNFRPILFGIEKDYIQQVARPFAKNVSIFSGSLYEAKCELANCAGFLGTDSGLLHVASALGVPALGLYGPTMAKTCKPPAVQTLAMEISLPCRPCNQEIACPIEQACLNGIDLRQCISQFRKLVDA